MATAVVDVAIIGGGLVGCFSGYFLRQRGKSVAIIEKGKACGAASGVNFGNLRLQGRHPSEFPLSLRAQAIWEDLSRLAGEDCGVLPCGHLYLGFSPGDQMKLERTAREAVAAGLDVELLDGRAARRRWPILSPVVTGASWSSRDAVADPAIASPVVARLAARTGVDIREGEKVVSIERAGGGFILRLAGGELVACGRVVNAAGAWAGEFSAQLGEVLPMFAAGPPLFALTPQHTYDGPSLHAVDGTMLLRPGRNGEAVAGCYPRVKANVTSGTATVPPDRVVAGLARLTEVAPGLGSLRAGRVWSGVEGYLPDMLPVIGPSATTPGVLHAFGFSGHGYQLSPGVGAVIADLLADGATETPIEPFSVRRFAQGVIADDKLSSEFDPAAIGNVRQASGASGNA